MPERFATFPVSLTLISVHMLVNDVQTRMNERAAPQSWGSAWCPPTVQHCRYRRIKHTIKCPLKQDMPSQISLQAQVYHTSVIFVLVTPSNDSRLFTVGGGRRVLSRSPKWKRSISSWYTNIFKIGFIIGFLDLYSLYVVRYDVSFGVSERCYIMAFKC